MISRKRARTTVADPAFREAVAKALTRYMYGNNPEQRKLTGVELAHRLGVSKSAVSKYLRAKLVIGGELLGRMFIELGIVVEYRQRLISARDAVALVPQPKPAEQIAFLFDRPCAFEETNEHVAVTVRRKQPHQSQVTVQMKIAG